MPSWLRSSRCPPERTQARSIATAWRIRGLFGWPSIRSAYGSTSWREGRRCPALHRVDQLRDRHLLRAADAALDPVGQRLRAVDRAVAEVVVRGARAARLLVVPVGEVRLVDRLRMRARRVVARHRQVRVPVLPLEPRAHREVRAGPCRPHRVVARVEVRDVVVVDVEPVEGEADLRGGALEVGRPLDRVRVVQRHESERRVRLVVVGHAQLRERHRLAVHRATRGHQAEVGALGVQRLRPGGVSSAALGVQLFVFSITSMGRHWPWKR